MNSGSGSTLDSLIGHDAVVSGNELRRKDDPRHLQFTPAPPGTLRDWVKGDPVPGSEITLCGRRVRVIQRDGLHEYPGWWIVTGRPLQPTGR